ncbi:hypothetical protein N494_19190 (plasmid) [Clostridium botulinum A2B7 92]|uniref:Uncharacterized protein n=2 Tax=Clostridium botulinum TaxID=1491 RepID=A0A846J609_CLOBO|nr:hypothetical protein [Clostridium botulinum]ACA57499.1 conserved hypothetical protein [Clostridium botulinum A3 str. Loch Maree]KEI94232.1 hypothetical protein N494_19190 [Clostridium botulinum A2B7 92]MBD5631150.1 hypothetical protein [Clostridium botulinum]NFH65550.1 hypothetical protein [Clostridium botulinum]NFJ09408.1 hypothetical protein [Clostridium botulinum]
MEFKEIKKNYGYPFAIATAIIGIYYSIEKVKLNTYSLIAAFFIVMGTFCIYHMFSNKIKISKKILFIILLFSMFCIGFFITRYFIYEMFI